MLVMPRVGGLEQRVGGLEQRVGGLDQREAPTRMGLRSGGM